MDRRGHDGAERWVRQGRLGRTAFHRRCRVLWVVIGIVGIIVAGQILGWIIGALWNILVATLIIAAIAGVSLLVFGAVRRSVGGSDRRQLPR